MNTMHKKLIGATIGGAVGYFIASVIVEYIKLKEELTSFGPEVTAVWIDEYTQKEEIKTMKNTEPAKKRDYTQFFSSQDRPDLADLVKKYNGEKELEFDPPVTPMEEEEELYTDSDEQLEDTPQPIRVITLMEYANDDEYEHITLNAYDDDVVTEGSQDILIKNPEELIGEEALVSFGEGTNGDEDVVYVVNDNLKKMYEVVRTNKEYATTKIRKARRAALSKKENNNEEEPNS